MEKQIQAAVKARRQLSPREARSLILFAAILFGALFRFLPAAFAGFPLNDGGMFYSMMNDLRANNFAPPLFTTYNHIGIPFAYPPLALYLGALIESLFHVSGIAVLRWLPPLLNLACVPVLYLLARELLEDELVAAAAALLFACIPHLNTWLSAGGGLTRSLGTLFMMLTVLHAHRLFVHDSRGSIWWTILYGALTVLSHTESTIFAIGWCAVIWMVLARDASGLRRAAIVALGVIVLAGPWYGFVILTHGAAPIVSALGTGGHALSSLLRLINVHQMTEEPYLDLLGVLGVLGLIFLIVRNQYLIPALVISGYLFEPRSAHTVANIPLAIAAALFVIRVLIPALALESKTAIRLAVVLVAPYLLLNSVYQGYLASRNHVTTGEQAAMHWIVDNTPAQSQFLVLTGEPESMCEAAAEWFPALTNRTSIATVQGREWTLGSKFLEFIAHQRALQGCVDQDEACIERALPYFSSAQPYIFITDRTPTNACKPTDDSLRATRGLIISLKSSSQFELMYESPDAAIFKPK